MLGQSIRTLTVVGLAVSLAACAPAAPPDTTAEDTTAINQVRSDWSAAYSAGDIDGLLGLYTDDYVGYPQNAPTATGPDALRANFEAQLTGMTASAEVRSEEMLLFGDHAVDRGTFSSTLVPEEGGDPVMIDGRYMVLLRRDADGTWKLARAIENSPTPLEGTGG